MMDNEDKMPSLSTYLFLFFSPAFIDLKITNVYFNYYSDSYVCVCVCVCVSPYIYIYMCVCVFVFVYACVCMSLYVCVCVRMYANKIL